MKALRFDQLSFRYQVGPPIFKEMSCVLANRRSDEGYIIALMGASGSGKSTLLKLILNTLAPTGGSIQYEPGSPLISYVPQEAILFDHLTPLENARYFARIAFYKQYFDEELFHDLSERLGMIDLLRDIKSIAHLSGGQKQRLLLLRALSIRPDILLLDEPTTGLDAEVKLSFLNELRSIVMNQQLLAVYVTHHRLEAEFVADEIAFLSPHNEAGIQIYQQPVQDFISRPPVLAAVNLFNYPTPNILTCSIDPELRPVVSSDSGAGTFQLVVAPENVGFTKNEGMPFTIISTNAVYTTIALMSQKITVKTDRKIFATNCRCFFKGEVLLYEHGLFSKAIKY